MGICHAKCEQCWDTIPCNCECQKDRDASSANAATQETHRLLREQNRLIQEQNELLKAQQRPRRGGVGVDWDPSR